MTDHPAGREPGCSPSPKRPTYFVHPVATLRYWRHLGTGPRRFRLGRRVLYRTDDLHAWMRNSTRRPSTVDERASSTACRPPQRLETALTRGAVVGTVI